MTRSDEDLDWLATPWPVALAIVVLIVACIVSATSALAEERSKGVVFDCEQLGRAMEGVATVRDVGADVDKTVAAVLARNPAAPRPQLEVLAREIRRVWSEGLPAREAGFAVYLRCQQQLGDMGRES